MSKYSNIFISEYLDLNGLEGVNSAEWLTIKTNAKLMMRVTIFRMHSTVKVVPSPLLRF